MSTIVVVAARGNSWLELRAGSATGRSLYQATLAAGQRVRVKGRKVWLRAGAASHLDISVDGEPLQHPLFGTVATVLPPS